MVLGIDDLLIAAAVTAIVSYATSELAASEREGAEKDAAGRQRDLDLHNSRVNWYLDQAAKSGRDVSGLRALQNRHNIDRGYEGAMQAAEQRRSISRDAAIGNAAAGFLSTAVGAAARGNYSGANTQEALQRQAADYVNRAQAGYSDLNGAAFGLAGVDAPREQTFQPRMADPNGGFQLQESDYGLFGGDPNRDRYRFRL